MRNAHAHKFQAHLLKHVLWATLFFFGCAEHDLGQECPQLLEGQAPAVLEDTDATTLEIVEQSTRFPCEDLVCVATAGISGYCSRKCNNEAQCPNGFTCSKVQPLGPFANTGFCVWRTCENRQDCSDDNALCCKTVANADAQNSVRICGFNTPEAACLN